MSTKTMRLPSRRVPWPTVPNSNKRKERDQASPSSKPTSPVTKLPKPTSPFTKLSRPRSGPEPIVPNHMLLAGYLANEFLTKGTLLGRNLGQPVNPDVESKQQKHERYVELSLFLKTEGAHLFGIVNPTQLAHFLKL